MRKLYYASIALTRINRNVNILNWFLHHVDEKLFVRNFYEHFIRFKCILVIAGNERKYLTKYWIHNMIYEYILCYTYSIFQYFLLTSKPFVNLKNDIRHPSHKKLTKGILWIDPLHDQSQTVLSPYSQ